MKTYKQNINKNIYTNNNIMNVNNAEYTEGNHIRRQFLLGLAREFHQL